MHQCGFEGGLSIRDFSGQRWLCVWQRSKKAAAELVQGRLGLVIVDVECFSNGEG